MTPLHQILRASYPGFSSKPFYNTHINAQIIKLLIEHKADIYSKDKDGNSCIDYLFKYYLHPWAYGESKDKYLFDKFIENLNTNQLRDIKKYILNKINLFSFEIEKQDLYISNLNICLLRIDKIITLIESKFAKTNEPRLKMIEDYFELPPEILTVNVKNFLEDESKKISLTELKECDKHSKKKKSLETKLLSEDFI